MSLRIFKLEEYDHTHEREQFRVLCELLKESYDNTPTMHLLFANINFGGVPLDALFIKPDAIIVIEFKNYGGNVIAAENGDWRLDDGTIVKGGMGKNPYSQTRNNKFAVLNTLGTWFPRTSVNLGHISGIVVFNRDVHVEDQLISPRTRTWFHITDMSHVADKISDITSNAIHYSENDMDDLPKVLNCCDSDLIYSSPDVTNRPVIDVTNTHLTTHETSLSDQVRTILCNNRYTIIHEIDKPGKEASYYNGDLNLGQRVQDYVNRNYNGHIYKHQHAAANLVNEGRNVCITTSTSSGKTAIFHMAALEVLERDPQARIIAVYPMKALGTQQEQSWGDKLEGVSCGRIDGNVQPEDRLRIMTECQVIAITPDTIHTFLLGKLKDNRYTPALRTFLMNLKLIIIDEIHLYRGMLGSNSAYLFRRLNSCITLLGGRVPQYITASATINDPAQHSYNISGSSGFEIIGPDMDTSPSCPTKIFLVSEGEGLANMITRLTQDLPNNKSISFIDSRKDVTQVANVADNALGLQGIGIYPFKSGLEVEDYNSILNALTHNQFKGVVSTSSLEVGIDIGDLDIAILKGIPNSSTSFYQRIGRVGRGANQNEAVVIIMNNPNSIVTQRMFRNPQNLLNLPAEEPALYLDNNNLVNIQALHFVGEGKEFQSAAGNDTIDIFGTVKDNFPDKFNSICYDVLNNQEPNRIYTGFREAGGDYPELTYTLRQFDVQYKAFERDSPDVGCGSLSMQNILREAYPEAIYIYMRIPRRVIKVDKLRHEVVLEREIMSANVNYIKTKPRKNTIVTPQKRTVLNKQIAYGNFRIINMEISELTQIKGYEELTKYRNGSMRREIRNYPNRYSLNVFSHTMMTQGVIIYHPSFDTHIQRSLIATLLYECFLSDSAFERSDIESASGRLSTNIGDLQPNTPFISIYDKNNGGLNITSRLMDEGTLKRGFRMMVDLIDNGLEDEILGISLQDASKDAIRQMYREIFNNEPVETGNITVSEFVVAKDSTANYTPDTNQDLTETVLILDVVFDQNQQEYYYYIQLNNGDEVDDVPEGQITPIVGVSYKGRLRGRRIINTNELW
jgi:DEAD/DEAH box helicase domain-containing protein